MSRDDSFHMGVLSTQQLMVILGPPSYTRHATIKLLCQLYCCLYIWQCCLQQYIRAALGQQPQPGRRVLNARSWIVSARCNPSGAKGWGGCQSPPHVSVSGPYIQALHIYINCFTYNLHCFYCICIVEQARLASAIYYVAQLAK